MNITEINTVISIRILVGSYLENVLVTLDQWKVVKIGIYETRAEFNYYIPQSGANEEQHNSK